MTCSVTESESAEHKPRCWRVSLGTLFSKLSLHSISGCINRHNTLYTIQLHTY